jgi:uncharacterized short protein YbdD (DUF466 family)
MGAPRSQGAPRSLGERLASAARALRMVLGAPDYERYLSHARERHPEVPPLSRDEFVAARLRARYERPGSRCC